MALISWWALAETSGTRVDAVSGSANDLTANGTVTRVAGPNGNVTYGVSLGASNYLSRADASLSTGFPGKTTTAELSMSAGCWVKANTLGSVQQGIFNKGDAWFIYVDTDNKLKISAYTDSWASFPTVATAAAISTATWYHVVFVWDKPGTTLTMYVNGSSVGTASMATMNEVGSGQALWIGRANLGGSPYFDGSIAEPFVFDSVLTSGQITTIYAGGIGALSSASVTVNASLLSASWAQLTRTVSGSGDAAVTAALQAAAWAVLPYTVTGNTPAPWPTIRHRNLLGVG